MSPSGETLEPFAERPPLRLRRLFVGIVLVEILTIAALYWFGRHFV